MRAARQRSHSGLRVKERSDAAGVVSLMGGQCSAWRWRAQNVLRAMTPEQRLRKAFELTATAPGSAEPSCADSRSAPMFPGPPPNGRRGGLRCGLRGAVLGIFGLEGACDQ